MTRVLYQQADHVAAQQLHGQPTRRALTVFAVVSIAAVGLVYFTGSDRGLPIGSFIWIPLAILLFGWLIWGVFIPLQARRHFERQPLAQLPLEITLLPEGIRTQGERGGSTLLWQDMTHWRANARVVLVYLSPRLFLHFPTRLAGDGFPIEELKASLARELGPAKR